MTQRLRIYVGRRRLGSVEYRGAGREKQKGVRKRFPHSLTNESSDEKQLNVANQRERQFRT